MNLISECSYGCNASVFVDYICTAGIDGQEAFAKKTLRARGKLAPVWPFVGIVAQVSYPQWRGLFTPDI